MALDFVLQKALVTQLLFSSCKIQVNHACPHAADSQIILGMSSFFVIILSNLNKCGNGKLTTYLLVNHILHARQLVGAFDDTIVIKFRHK